MFDIGFWELMLVAFVAVCVLGPERLHHLFHRVGRSLGRARTVLQSYQAEWDLREREQKARAAEKLDG